MTTEAEARRIVQRVLTLARGDSAEVTVALAATTSGNSRFAVGEITSSADVEQRSLSVTIQLGKRSATATTNQLDDRALADVVGRTKRMARISPENPEAMPPLGRQSYRPAPGARDAATAATTPADRARTVAAALRAGDTRVTLAGFHEHAARAHAIATSAGLWTFHTWTTTRLTCTARTTDGTGSGWAGGHSHRMGDLDAARLAKLAVDKAVASRNPTKLSPGRYTVILEPQAVADLLGWFVGALGARRADEGRSFFSRPGGTRVGDKLFPDAVTVRSDPTDAQLVTTPFDREGVPLAPTTWIDRGVIKGLIYDRYWARRQGKPATGQPAGWVLEGGTATREELLRGVERGVLITRLWYIRSLDPQTILVTGLTRDGTFLVEKGAITRPVMNFRFNDSPVQMLTRCDAMTPAVVAGRMRVPALRTHDFHLASVSEAV
jgi:predicted Zn-dependent protease